MKNDEIVIQISKHINLSDAVCKAMHPQRGCQEKNLHQTVKVSQSQDKLSANGGIEYSVDGHSSVI